MGNGSGYNESTVACIWHHIQEDVPLIMYPTTWSHS
jgi:hypothetical protein